MGIGVGAAVVAGVGALVGEGAGDGASVCRGDGAGVSNGRCFARRVSWYRSAKDKPLQRPMKVRPFVLVSEAQPPLASS